MIKKLLKKKSQFCWAKDDLSYLTVENMAICQEEFEHDLMAHLFKLTATIAEEGETLFYCENGVDNNTTFKIKDLFNKPIISEVKFTGIFIKSSNKEYAIFQQQGDMYYYVERKYFDIVELDEFTKLEVTETELVITKPNIKTVIGLTSPNKIDLSSFKNLKKIIEYVIS